MDLKKYNIKHLSLWVFIFSVGAFSKCLSEIPSNLIGLIWPMKVIGLSCVLGSFTYFCYFYIQKVGNSGELSFLLKGIKAFCVCFAMTLLYLFLVFHDALLLVAAIVIELFFCAWSQKEQFEMTSEFDFTDGGNRSLKVGRKIIHIDVSALLTAIRMICISDFFWLISLQLQQGNILWPLLKVGSAALFLVAAMYGVGKGLLDESK